MIATHEDELDTLGMVNVLQPSMDLQTDLLKHFVKLTDQLPKDEKGACPNLSDVREKLLDHVLEKVELLLETDACSIYIKDAQNLATMRAARGYQKPKVGTATRKIVSAGEVKDKPGEHERLGLTSWIISTGRSFLATQPEGFFNHPHWSGQFDKSTDDDHGSPEEKRSLAAFLGIPLRDSRGQVIGALKAQRSLPGKPFSVENQITLEALGQVAGRCIAYVDDAEKGPVAAAIVSWALKIFSDASTAEGELDSFLDIVVRVVAASSQADACSVFLIDESERTLTQRAGCGHQSLKNTIRSYKLPDRSTLDDCFIFEACNPATCQKKSNPGLPEDKKVGITAWVASTGKSFYANSKGELRQHCHHQGLFDRENFKKNSEQSDSYLEECSAWFGVPLIVGGATIGVIKIENKTTYQVVDTRQFSTEVKQQLEILSQDIAISIRRLQIQSNSRYEVINKAMPTILTILQGGLDIPELVQSVVRETAKLFNARACALFLKEGNKLIQPDWAAVGYAQAGTHTSGYIIREYDLVPLETIEAHPNPSKEEKDKRVGLTVWIAVTKQRFSARSNLELTLHQHHKGTYDEKNFRDQERCESFMGVPLLVGEQKELIGVLKVETKQRINGDRVDYSYFNEQDSLVFNLIANSVAIAIQNARLLAARRLADRLQQQPNRYSTLKEFFGFIDQRVDVVNTLEGAVRNVSQRDAKKAQMIENAIGILRPDFNVALLGQFAYQIRDSKDTNCVALTSLLDLITKMLQVKNLAEISQINPAANTPRGIHDPAWVLYDCAQKILDTHQVISEHLNRHARERSNTIELKNSLDLLEKETDDAKNLTLFKQNIVTRIFSHWQGIIRKELGKQQEIPNPYIAGVPLGAAQSSVFYGREEIFKWIDDSLHGQKVVLILHGGWHTGKTSILKQIQAGPFGEYIRERNLAVPVYVDLQDIPDASTAIFLLNLADEIYEAVDSPELDDPDTLQASFEKTPYRTFNKFLRKVTTILAKQGKKNLIIMLDEFELLDIRVQQNKLDAEIFNYLRSQMQHHASLSFILAGRHRLEEMTSEFRNIIFNVGYHKEVGFLNKPEAQRLITEPVKPYAVSYTPACVERILKLTGGHPFFIQQLCKGSIVLLNNRKKGYEVTSEILNQAIEESLKYNQILQDLWDEELSDYDQKLFQILADQITDDDIWAQENEVIRLMNIPADDVMQILQQPVIQKLLLRRKTTDQKVEIAFGVDMFRLWIIRNSRSVMLALPHAKENNE